MPAIIKCGLYKLLRPVLVFVTSLILTSCGAKNGEESTGVSLAGKVTYKGKPVAGGITLESQTGGKKAAAAFAEDGTYTIDNAPPGKAKVTVNLSPRHMAKAAGNNKLPATKEANRTLPSIDLHSGKNEFSVDLP
jgi:hypothetical protein